MPAKFMMPLVPSREPKYFSHQVKSAKRFHILDRASKPLEIVSGGCEECGPDYDLRRIKFRHLVLEFVARGAGRIQLGNKSWNLQAGTIFLYDNSLPHRISSVSPQGMTKYFAVLRGPAAKPRLMRYGLRPGLVTQVQDVERVRSIFEDLVELGSHPRRHRQESCWITLHYLLQKIGELAVSDDTARSAAFSSYMRCRHFMQEHCAEITSARQVADACHLDNAYMCRLFQRFGTESPYESLWKLRMNHAAHLLQSSKMSIKQVADEMHFSDPAAFSRSVKRAFGLPPSKLKPRGC